MKVFPMLKKNALYITLAVLVALFVYYVYMNNYYEHATTYTSPRVCALMTNTTNGQKITVNVYAVDSNRAVSNPTYTGKKVLSTSIDANKSKTLKFISGNYGFIVKVSNPSSTINSTYTLTNIALQKKSSKKDMWGRKRTTYKCSSTISAPTASVSTTSPVPTINGVSDLGLILSSATATQTYSRMYENAANNI